MHVSDVDPDDDDAFGAWFAVVDACWQHDRPGEVGWLPAEQRELAREGRRGPDGALPADELQELWLARDGDRVVGAAKVELPLQDNTHVAAFTVCVAPDARRRGVGRELLRVVRDAALAAGRTSLVTEVDEPPHLEGRSAGRAFAAAHGFAPVLEEVRRDLALPVPDERIDAVEAPARERAAGYAVVPVDGGWPDELVDQRAELGRRMSTDVPLGDLDWREEVWDADRVRRQEELCRRQGRRLLGAGAVHRGTGALVAFTELVVPLAAPSKAWQSDTLVVAEHRGRRLGTLVKTAALRQLQREVPEARVVTTHNARENRWMIAVNDAVGFRPNGVLTEWQRAV